MIGMIIGLAIMWVCLGFIPAIFVVESWPGWEDFRLSKLTVGYITLFVLASPAIVFVLGVELLRKTLRRIGRIKPFGFLERK
jgi:hypothetical protein